MPNITTRESAPGQHEVCLDGVWLAGTWPSEQGAKAAAQMAAKRAAQAKARLRASKVAPTHEADFSQEPDQWEDAVFLHASHFVVVYYRGLAQSTRWDDMTSFPAALETARTRGEGETKQRLLYAVSPRGRHVCLDRADWDRLLAMWPESDLGKAAAQ